MKKEEFLTIQNELKGKLGRWKLEIGVESFADFSMGCFYENTEKLWKVYVNNERGRHRIRFSSENESDAFDELLSLVNFEIENNRYI